MEYGGEYGFQHLPNVKFQGLNKAGVKESLVKWSMVDGLKVQAYSFSRPFKKYLHEDFVKDFFSCQAVTSTLERSTEGYGYAPIGIPADRIKMSEIACTATTIEMFDKLFEEDVICRKNGTILQCIPLYISPSRFDYDRIKGEGDRFGGTGDGDHELLSHQEIEVGDKLRKLIILMKGGQKAEAYSFEDEDEDLCKVFSEKEQDEFMFLLFGHLVIGGSLCQYEDNVQPYIETTKVIYKDLVSVSTVSPSTSVNEEEQQGPELSISSFVYKVYSVSNDMVGSSSNGGTGNGKGFRNFLFHKNMYNNFLYIIVNPTKQTCYTLYHHA